MTAQARDERAALDEKLLELSDGILVLDAEWRVVRVNAEQERLSGLPREQTLGRTFDEIWPLAREKAASFVAHYERCMRERITVDFEEYWAPADAWRHITARPPSSSAT